MALIGYLLIIIILLVLIPLLTLLIWGINKLYYLKNLLFGGKQSNRSNTWGYSQSGYSSGSQQRSGTSSGSNSSSYSSGSSSGYSGGSSSGYSGGSQHRSNTSGQRNKIIPKDEGEYVDFEEV